MVDNIATRPAGSTAGRALNIVLWALQVLLAVGFALSAVAKFTASPQAVSIFEAMGTGGWMPYVIGALEVAGAIGLLIPRLAGTAALAFALLMAGAVISHLALGGDFTAPIVLLVLSAVVAWGRRASIVALVPGSGRA